MERRFERSANGNCWRNARLILYSLDAVDCRMSVSKQVATSFASPRIKTRHPCSFALRVNGRMS